MTFVDEPAPRVHMPGAPTGTIALFLYALRLALRNLPVLIGIALPLAATTAVFTALAVPTLHHPSHAPGVVPHVGRGEWISLAGLIFLNWTVGTWTTTALSQAFHSLVTTGRAVGFREAYGRALERFPATFVVQVLSNSMIFGGLIACVVPGLWLMVIYVAAFPRAATREVGPIDALRESKALVRGRFWPTAGYVSMLAAVIVLLNVPHQLLLDLPDRPVWLLAIVGAVTTALIHVFTAGSAVALHERLEETAG